jgi:hypothetical protein
MLTTFERIVTIFSMCFQGWSLVVNIDAVLYAIVSLVVLAIQLAMEFNKGPSDNPIVTRALTANASIMCVLSVASNFFDADIQTVGRFLTTAGVIQETFLLGAEAGKAPTIASLFGLEPEKRTSGLKKKSKRKKA